jgi:hypothetical protein
MTRRRIEELLLKHEPRIQRRFRRALSRARDRWTVAKLEAALEGGAAEAVGQVLDDVERAGSVLAARTEAITVLVANEVADQLGRRYDKLVTYDGTNERAAAAMRSNRLRIRDGFTQQQREVIADVFSDGAALGINPREQAIAIRDGLGLSRGQARWVRSYRRRLMALDRGALDMELRDARYDGTVKRAIDTGKALTPKQVDTMVERYYQRAVKYRSELIARTETVRAVHEGAEEMYQQGIDAGTVDQRCIVCKWHAVGLPRSRHWHASMKGQKRRWGEAFRSGQGNLLRFPGDPNAPTNEVAHCICGKSTRIYSTPELAEAALAEAA